MSKQKDRTRLILEQLLSQLHKEIAEELASEPESRLKNESYLIADDKQFLGKLTGSRGADSILNKYGPYGSIYSATSIFNRYSQYGSHYGAYSINNPACSTPPRLYIKGKYAGLITANKQLADRIPAGTFLYLLSNDLEALMQKRFDAREVDIRSRYGESFIIAEDGQFLGKLIANPLDNESLLNEVSPYGNEYSPTSIFNEFGDYGSEFSTLSPFNQFSSTPPRIFVKGKLYGYLTENKSTPRDRPRVDPRQLKQWIASNF